MTEGGRVEGGAKYEVQEQERAGTLLWKSKTPLFLGKGVQFKKRESMVIRVFQKTNILEIKLAKPHTHP